MPGTTDIGNHGDDGNTPSPCHSLTPCMTRPINSINLSSNGNAQFTTTRYRLHQHLPAVDHPQLHHLPVLGRPEHRSKPVHDYPGTCGIFTSISGTAPNRIFNIEWRARYTSREPDGCQLRAEVVRGTDAASM